MARTRFKKVPFNLELARNITNKKVKGRIVTEDGLTYKLMIIQKAINNGVLLDKGGWRYHPYWELYPKREIERMNEEDMQRNGIRRLLTCADAPDTDFSGVRRAGTCSSGASFMFTDCSSSLCFNSKEAALYAAHQFEDLFFQYYGIKVKA